MKADIFIPTSGRIESLRQCLASLEKQSSRNFRVILAGLKENKAVEDLANSFSGLDMEYFVQEKPGLLNAANESLEKAGNEIFIRTDDDVVFDESWLLAVMKTFAADKMIGGVTGPTVMSNEGLAARDLTAVLKKIREGKNPFCRLLYKIFSQYLYESKMYAVEGFLKSGVFTLGTNFEKSKNIRGLKDVTNLEACNWAVRTSLLKKIGGFDKAFEKGLGDYHEADAALRIKKLGYRLVFNSQAAVRHRVETGKVPPARPEAYWRIQNFIIFYFRHIGINKLDYLGRFLINLFFQNGYYLAKFIITGKISQLGSVAGTAVGLAKAGLKKYERH